MQQDDPAPAHRNMGDVIRWLVTREPGEWRVISDVAPGSPPPARVEGDRLRVTYVNHATLLVQTAGVNILTDPIWSERASPLRFYGPKRYRPPGIRFEDLPPIDVVVVSHDHYDHMDLETLRRLCRQHAPLVLVGRGNKSLLDAEGIENVVELSLQESHEVRGVRIHGVPAQHWSGRGAFDRGKRLWLGFVIDAPGGPVFFAGDTGMGAHFEALQRRFGPMRLALLPIGGYLPRWFMAPVHLSPEEAVEVHRLLRARTSVAMHFGTFALADDAQFEAEQALGGALAQAGIGRDEFRVLDFGEGQEIPRL